jgi:hypothetical protein
MSTITQPDKVKDQLNNAIVDYYLEMDERGNFVHPPGHGVKHLDEKDPERIRVENEELDEFIQVAFGVKIPKKVIEIGHRAPFDFVADLFYERVKNAIAFANRTGGKTLSVAILNLLDMLFKPECEVASAGAVLDQANKCYRYFCSFLRKSWFRRFNKRYEQIKGRPFIRKNIQSWTKFDNESLQEIVTGSEQGLRSPHPHKARIDEVDLIPWSTLQVGLSMARSTDAVLGQNVFTSTRQLAAGSMQRLLDEAPNKGIEVYEWNAWEAVEKCTRRCFDDLKYGTCPIYVFCQGKAHHCEGFYKIGDFIEKVRLLDRETFETEWLNQKPSRGKLVYHMFDNTRHVMTPDRLLKMTGVRYPSKYWAIVSAIDFGSGPDHPFVYLKLCHLPGGQYLVFYEYYAEQRLLRDHAHVIKSSPYYMPGERIYADWAAQERLELKQEHKVATKQAIKDVLTGIDYVKTLFSGFPPNLEPQLFVWHDCVNIQGELGKYQWPVRANGQVDRTGLPLKRYDHGPDCLRYALYSDRHVVHTRYRTANVPGI